MLTAKNEKSQSADDDKKFIPMENNESHDSPIKEHSSSLYNYPDSK